MTDVPEHDDADELERSVAHDESVSAAEREAMLDALRRMRARVSGPPGHGGPTRGRSTRQT